MNRSLPPPGTAAAVSAVLSSSLAADLQREVGQIVAKQLAARLSPFVPEPTDYKLLGRTAVYEIRRVLSLFPSVRLLHSPT